MTHAELVARAERFLRSMNCKVIFNDNFRAVTPSGEQPDCIGFMSGISFLIECKASRSDFLADKKKDFRRDPETGMGDWRFFLCPPGIIKPEDLPDGWGLLWCHPRKIEKVHGIPTNCQYHNKRPFKGNRDCEMQLMLSALRRMEIRGHLKEIYDGLPVKAGAA
jgi:hypothetical protein